MKWHSEKKSYDDPFILNRHYYISKDNNKPALKFATHMDITKHKFKFKDSYQIYKLVEIDGK